MGATTHMMITKPATTLAAAHQGVSNGEPMYAICAQSNVKGNKPSPEEVPNFEC